MKTKQVSLTTLVGDEEVILLPKTLADLVICDDGKTLTAKLEGMLSDFQNKIPTNVSSLINDSGYVTSEELGEFTATRKLEYESYLNFPTMPEARDKDSIFVDKQTTKNYRWDDVALKYYVIGVDYDNIQLITGGSSE